MICSGNALSRSGFRVLAGILPALYLISASPAAAEDPEQLIRRVYAAFGQEHRSDVFTISVMMEKKNRAKYFAPQLVRLFDANDASQKRSQPCIDFIIVVNGQDYDEKQIQRTLKIDSRQQGPKTFVVARFNSFDQPNEIQFEFVDDGSGPRIADIASLQGSLWKLSDVRCSSDPFWVGRWYIDDDQVCQGKPMVTEGLLVYTPKVSFGYENRCTITKAVRRKSDYELRMQCRGEGVSFAHKEIVEDVGGQLRRYVEEGRRLEAYTYKRCPP